MVSEDFELFWGAFQEVSPFLQGSDEFQHFFVIDLIVTFDI